MMSENQDKAIENSPIVTEGYQDPITCYFNSKPYQYLGKV